MGCKWGMNRLEGRPEHLVTVEIKSQSTYFIYLTILLFLNYYLFHIFYISGTIASSFTELTDNWGRKAIKSANIIKIHKCHEWRARWWGMAWASENSG